MEGSNVTQALGKYQSDLSPSLLSCLSASPRVRAASGGCATEWALSSPSNEVTMEVSPAPCDTLHPLPGLASPYPVIHCLNSPCDPMYQIHWTECIRYIGPLYEMHSLRVSMWYVAPLYDVLWLGPPCIRYIGPTQCAIKAYFVVYMLHLCKTGRTT